MEKRLFPSITAITYLALVVVCVLLYRPVIEKDLARRTDQVLRANGLSQFEVQFSGRDASITILEAADWSRVQKWVEGVFGVRTAQIKVVQKISKAPAVIKPIEPTQVVTKVAEPRRDLASEVSQHKFHFGFDRVEVLEPDQQVSVLSELLKGNPHLKFRITGHTDAKGKTSYNMKLGLRRAEAVRSILVKSGVPEANLEIESGGESHFVASNDTAEGRSQNRRVEFRFLGTA